LAESPCRITVIAPIILLSQQICRAKTSRNAGIGTVLAAILAETNIFFSFLKVLWLLLAWRVPSPPQRPAGGLRRRDFFLYGG
jgi:hypothetical protein